MDLALLVPSRERPHNIERLMEAMDRTCRGDTQLVVGVDDDDPLLADYYALERDSYGVVCGEPNRLVAWLNLLARPAAKNFPYIGHIGDDNVPRTIGWDVRVMESLAGTNFCFTDDLDPGRESGSLCLTIFMRSEVVKTLGYMGPPQIQHMYVDPVWFAWGKATSIEFLSDTVIEHLHYTQGHAPNDASYERSTGLIPEDCKNYNDYCEDGSLNADIEKLGGVPFTDAALAEFNAKLNIPRRK